MLFRERTWACLPALVCCLCCSHRIQNYCIRNSRGYVPICSIRICIWFCCLCISSIFFWNCWYLLWQKIQEIQCPLCERILFSFLLNCSLSFIVSLLILVLQDLIINSFTFCLLGAFIPHTLFVYLLILRTLLYHLCCRFFPLKLVAALLLHKVTFYLNSSPDKYL